MSLALGLFLIETGRAPVIDPSTLNIDRMNQFAVSISHKCVCLASSEVLESLPGTARGELFLGKSIGVTNVSNRSNSRNSSAAARRYSLARFAISLFKWLLHFFKDLGVRPDEAECRREPERWVSGAGGASASCRGKSQQSVEAQLRGAMGRFADATAVQGPRLRGRSPPCPPRGGSAAPLAARWFPAPPSLPRGKPPTKKFPCVSRSPVTARGQARHLRVSENTLSTWKWGLLHSGSTSC